jgi:hypothetical protein
MYLIAKKMIENNKKWAKHRELEKISSVKFSKFNVLYNNISKLYKVWR